MTLDQAEAERLLVISYGGSDDTSPSFNRQRYVFHASRYEPKDLGIVAKTGLAIDGKIGAESGTQTLFWRLEVREQSRIEIRGVSLNPYTDQYISFGLREGSGSHVPVARETKPIPGIYIGYVDCGYWVTGYAEEDCVTAPAINGLGAEEAGPFFDRISAAIDPGVYELTLSSSQWQSLPYRLQLLVKPLSEDLGGTAQVVMGASGRISLQGGQGQAEVVVPAVARIAAFLNLAGEAGTSVPARAQVDRTSPYD